MRKTRFKESSLVVRAFLSDGSLVSLLFKGALRPKSALASQLLPFALLEFVFYQKEGRGVFTASEAFVVEDFASVRASYESQVVAASFLQRAASLIKPEQAIPEVFDITLALLRGWDDICRLPQDVVWAGFVLKLLTFAGFAPSIDFCAVCGGMLPPQGLRFSPAAGGVVCPACSAPNDAVEIDEALRRALAFMLAKPFRAYGRLELTPQRAKRARELLDRFWTYHIGEGASAT